MNLDSCNTLKESKEKKTPFLEVINAEKQLWTLIHSKGLIHPEVKALYYIVRSGYEKLLNDNEEVELQDIEHSLWKLHYKHIDEFRKRIKQNVANTQSSIDSHVKQFKSFLFEAIEFYERLIKKLRKGYGLSEDPLTCEKAGISDATEHAKLHKCQYSCHRLLVCLGDLARYRELCKKPDIERHNWAAAANYYFKAILVRLESGNPQNQLALLATYIGDDYLALYHCIRSLAIKEPFPDAWANLILLFEKNRSSYLHSISKEAHFDFLNPSARSLSLTESQSGCGSLNDDMVQSTEQNLCSKSDLWPIFVRMASFFLIESSFEEFSCTFASTVRELDLLLALDDAKLKDALQSYQHMDSTRRGPYRALQMVSILIFIVTNLTENLHENDSKEKKNLKWPTSIQLALVATFICLGRLVERCLKGNPLVSPLLPAVLVFVEWVISVVDKVETYSSCEKVRSAISYFFDTFVDLLNQLDVSKGEFKYQDRSALWEDYELRGFAPVAHVHGCLYFSTHPELVGVFDSTNLCRARCILGAAMQIGDRSGGFQNLIFYDNLARQFYTKEPKRCLDQRELTVGSSILDSKEVNHKEIVLADPRSCIEINGLQQNKCEVDQESGKGMDRKNETHPCENGVSIAMEEEEVILFKPITRYNSAPPCTSTTDGEMSTEGSDDHSVSSDECLCHATSLLLAQENTQIDPFNFASDSSNSMEKKQQEHPFKENPTYPAGPPSLSAWVLNRESSDIEKDNTALSPIDEAASASLTGLSVGETEDSVIPSTNISAATACSPPYMRPLPSAPLLPDPDEATWLSGNSPRQDIKEMNRVLGASPLSSCTNSSVTHGPFSYVPGLPRLIDGHQPVLGMSSSEWLHHYRNQNFDRASSQALPVHFYAPANLGNFPGHEVSRFDLYDWWGNPVNRLVYLESPQLHPSSPIVNVAGEQRGEKLFSNYQYLKEKEWQLQRQPQVRGPAYMGN